MVQAAGTHSQKDISAQRKVWRWENLTKKTPPETKGSEGKGRSNEGHQTKKKSSGTKHEQKKAFEAKKPRVCFKCQKPGYIAAGCRASSVAFFYISESEENMRLLEQYLSNLKVNGKECMCSKTWLPPYM